MNQRNLTAKFVVILFFVSLIWIGPAAASDEKDLTSQEKLGKFLFFDTDLSKPKGQACAVCHSPETGFTGPVSVINATIAVYPGAVPTRFGNRKPPTSAYGGDSPVLYQDAEGLWIGGMFWDGRATGETLGDPLAEQAQGPFLNALEQNIPDAKVVVDRVLGSKYSNLFKKVCGTNYDVANYYNCIGRSIAAYERSKEVNPFSSKYDRSLKGRATLTSQETWGLALFEGKGKCSNCHISGRGPNGELPLFTDFTYDNLGVPRNALNPFYYEPQWNPLGPAWVDLGLGFVKGPSENGKVKVPTLRNVDKRPNKSFVKDYGHNGYFKSLKEIVHFYNTRDTLPACAHGSPGEKTTCWPPPEVSENVNTEEVGNLGLTDEEEDAIVALLTTLSDFSHHDD
jgi:cytochrome c peroxidase